MNRTLFLIIIFSGMFFSNLNAFSFNHQSNIFAKTEKKETYKHLERDFIVKGFHLDLRIQVMTIPELKRFAKKLKQNGLNTLLMEWEASYPYEKHAVISNRYAYSREEIKDFISYCNGLEIDVIPLQQSFGHVEYILKHYKYKELRQDQKDYSQVNPAKVELCRELFSDLFKDLTSTHTSPYLHIGGDETYILDKMSISKEEKGKIYGDYIKMLVNEVIKLGKRPIVWADIALKYPDALKDLPKEIIFTDWNYGWSLDRFGKHENLMKSGHEIWGSPAIRSHPDNYYLVQWEKHFKNINTFIPEARNLGYQGMIMTSWSTSGIYSQVYESSSDVTDLIPVRRVYPQTGFNIIIDAYFASLKDTKPLNIDLFITDYTKSKFGFNPQQSAKFWKAINTGTYETQQGATIGSKIDIKTLLDSSKIALNELYTLNPKAKNEEYEHFLLMAEIRTFYLTCLWVEDQTNQNTYDNKKLLNELKKLDVTKLNEWFLRLNKHAYHSSELETENQVRNSRYYTLYHKLSRAK